MKKRILIAIVLALVFSQALNKEVFYANSPRINPIFIAKLQNSPQALTAFINKLSNSSQNLAEEGQPQEYRPLFKNVLAGETHDKDVIYIKITDPAIKTQVKDIILPDGKVVKFYKPILEQ